MNELPPLTLGDSSKLVMGEWVAAIGNSFGLSHTLTVGAISATGKNSLGIHYYKDYIQTDTTINSGSFGGPLINLNGDVIGINTVIFSKNSGHMSSGFAIPMKLANSIAKQLIAYQKVTRGHLGILIQELSPKRIKLLDLNKNEGVLVTHVMEGSPAAEGGIKQGDIIIFFRDKPVSSTSEFSNLVSISSPNSNVALTVIRDDKRIKFNVVIGKFTLNKDQEFTDEQPSEKLGFMVQNITSYLAEKLMIKSGQGVLITEVENGSIANMANIEIGSVILQVNLIKVENVEEFSRALNDSSKDKPVLLLIKTNHKQHYVLLNRS
jgi:serine protease Do